MLTVTGGDLLAFADLSDSEDRSSKMFVISEQTRRSDTLGSC